MGRIEMKRVWTGVLTLPPLVLLIVLGPFPLFALLVLVATFFGLREFYNLALPHCQDRKRDGDGAKLLPHPVSMR
jgi:CDP-diglyceride synthetase